MSASPDTMRGMCATTALTAHPPRSVEPQTPQRRRRRRRRCWGAWSVRRERAEGSGRAPDGGGGCAGAAPPGPHPTCSQVSDQHGQITSPARTHVYQHQRSPGKRSDARAVPAWHALLCASTGPARAGVYHCSVPPPDRCSIQRASGPMRVSVPRHRTQSHIPCCVLLVSRQASRQAPSILARRAMLPTLCAPLHSVRARGH